MRINNNIMAMNTHRQLGTAQMGGSKSMEKLSSGFRINKAGDDAAGLAISEKMRAQIRGLNQASRNAQDGISMIQTAEGALSETHNILQRMRELATQSASDTNVGVDRAEIQKEMNQLSSEINRIGNTTEFNTQALLKGRTQAVKEAAAIQKTITAGEAGVAVGETSGISIEKNSVVAKASTTSVQASKAAATGGVGVNGTGETTFKVTTGSTAHNRSSVTVSNGLTFETAHDTMAGMTALNGKNISMVQSTAVVATATSMALDGDTYTITIGVDADGNSLVSNRGELFNEVNTVVEAHNFATPNEKFRVLAPQGTDQAVTNVATTGTFTGGVNEVVGISEFDVKRFTEAGDTITIGGRTFTAVTKDADASLRQFNISDGAGALLTAEGQLDSLKLAIEADSVLKERFTVAKGTGTAGSSGHDAGAIDNKLVFTEKAGKATGVDLTQPIAAGSGADDKLLVTNNSGQNLKTVNIVASETIAAAASVAKNDATNFISLTAGGTGTELNGLKVVFSSLTEAAGADASKLEAKFDADTFTLTVTGSIKAADGQTALQNAMKKELVDVGFNSTQATVAVAKGGTGDYTHTILNGYASVKFGDTSGTNVGAMGAVAVADNDSMVVSQNNGSLTIHLANITASKNTAEEIQKAVQNLKGYTGGVDFSKMEFTTEGNWDTNTLGYSLAQKTGTLVGGTAEQKGEYNFEVTKAFAAGDIVEIKGQYFTAVESGADVTKGEFNVSGGNITAQVAGLADAISLNKEFSGNYDISTKGLEITLKEKEATGVDFKTTDIAVRATGTQGEYAMDLELLESGAKVVIDGQEILVSNKEAHSGYNNGTAIKEAGNLAEQTQSLVEAINKNANLNEKYSASVGQNNELVLTQTRFATTDTAPVVNTMSSSEGNFKATFQIGANTGQSMTIDIADTRSAALGITGDGTSATVMAKNGAEASYTTVENVSNGTSNASVEFALDVSTHEKATAAISVLNDAIEAVSAERSQLGSFQNRLEHTISNLGTSSENLQAAESRVRDVDMAAEMMQFTKNNILSQAATAMLAQANQAPQSVLQLLG